MTFTTLLFLGLILLLVLAFFAGITGRMSTPGTIVSVLAFLGLAAVALTAVFVPEPYENLADFGLKQAGVRDTIREIDDQFFLDDLAASGAGLADQLREALRGDDPLLDRLRGLLGDDVVGDESVAEEIVEEEAVDERGVFERRLYPALVDVFAGVLRIAALIAALSGLVAAVALAAASGAMRRIAAGSQRLERAEARIASLEAAARLAGTMDRGPATPPADGS